MIRTFKAVGKRTLGLNVSLVKLEEKGNNNDIHVDLEKRTKIADALMPTPFPLF
jgi:hypothetical protein